MISILAVAALAEQPENGTTCVYTMHEAGSNTVNLRSMITLMVYRNADQRKRQLMTKTRKNLLCRAAAVFMTAATVFSASPAAADAGFETWINSFYATAAKSGITKATYRQAFAGVKTPDPTVLEKARYQPEFKHKIWEYIDSRVNPYTRKIGQEMAVKHGRTLAALERHFGVDRNILLAIWSMESNYGCLLYTSPSPRD